MIKGILYGTFDLLHFGHIEAIKYAKSLCDELIVAVSTDEFNKGKGKKAEIPYWQRRELVESIKYVDLTIPEYSWKQKMTDPEKHNIDMVFISEEYFEDTKEDLEDLDVEVVCIPRTPNISSTQLRKRKK